MLAAGLVFSAMATDEDQAGATVPEAAVIERLSDAFRPFVREIDFNREHRMKAVDAGSIAVDLLLTHVLAKGTHVIPLLMRSGLAGTEESQEES